MHNHRCFATCYENTTLHTHIKLKIKINEKDTDFIIELPRQLLKVHNILENTVISLWELSLRKVYTERYLLTFFTIYIIFNIINIHYLILNFI